MSTPLPLICPKPPTRNTLRVWARARDHNAWQNTIDQDLREPAAAYSAIVALQSALRAGWVDGLNRLWDARVLPFASLLSIAWKDLRNPVWSGVLAQDRQAVEAWIEHKTWGAPCDEAHREAQAKAGTCAMRSALDNNVPQRWALALGHGTPVNNLAGHRLLTTLLGQHLDWSVNGRPLTGWRLTALYDLIDRQVPMAHEDLMAVFDRGEDELYHRCLAQAHLLANRTPTERSMLLAAAGVIEAYRHRTLTIPRKTPRPAIAGDRASRWFRAVMRYPIEPVLLLTPKDIKSLQKAGQMHEQRLWVRAGISHLYGPTLNAIGDDPRVVLYVADHWWLDNRAQVDEVQRDIHRAYLQGMVDNPRQKAELRVAIEQSTASDTPSRPRARL